MNYIIVDLESTCWENQKQFQKENSEIIEIGAVMLNDKFEEISRFQTFVKPLKYPELTDYCKNLTSIKQSDVDNAPDFQFAINTFRHWIDENCVDYTLVSWGYYDVNQLARNSVKSEISYDWLIDKHLNFSSSYKHAINSKQKLGMFKALQNEGLTLDGTHHRGIDDAINLAKLFRHFYSKNELKITYSKIKL